MTTKISPDDINKQLTAQLHALTPFLDQNSIDGCIARCQRDVLPAITHWRASEMNRGTDPPDLFNAVVLHCVGVLSAQFKQNGLELKHLPSLMDHFAETMRLTLTAPPEEWKKFATSVDGRETH